jgi:CzcA family heavy metal efflux pump
MDNLIRGSLRLQPVVVTVAVLVCAWGVATVLDMPVDVFPDLTAPTVTVMTEAPGMAPAEVEALVTFPLETALNGATGVRRVRSASAVGLSVVWVEFDWGFDRFAARQIVGEKVDMVAGELPDQAQAPVMAPASSIMGEIQFLGLVSDAADPVDLRAVAETEVRRRLLAVPGVSQVTVLGGGDRQYQVAVDPQRLRSLDLGVGDVAGALASANRNVSAGFLVQHGAEHVVQGVGRVEQAADLEAVVVANRGGAPVRVADLGRVRVGEGPVRGLGSVNGRRAVILGVQKQPQANTLRLQRQLDDVYAELDDRLPPGMTLDRSLFRQADFIATAVRNVEHALRDGALLVVLVMVLFLANVRASVITLTAIPVSVLVAVLLLRAFGATINTMTLGGIAIAVGALVDDAVIDVENVVRRLRQNAGLPDGQRRPAWNVVYEATVEIRHSITYATVIIMLVFVPLFFLTGVEGRLLVPLGAAYMVSLAASLLVAVTLTPALGLWLLPGSRAVRENREAPLVRWLKRRYDPLLRVALDRPWWFAAPASVLLVGAVVWLGSAGRSFLPEFNEGSLTVAAVTVPGTPIGHADTLGRVIEDILHEQSEVVSTARRTGRAELDQHAMSVESSEIDVTLAMGDRPREEFLADLRHALTEVPGTNITIGQPIGHRIDHMLSGSRANVAVKIFGDDLLVLRRLAQQAQAAMADVPGVVDLAAETQADIPILSVRFDREALGRHGLALDDAADALAAAYAGLPVSRVLEGQVAYDLVVRLDDGEPWTAERLADVPVATPGGGHVPLGAVALISRQEGPNLVSREAARRKIVVTCNVAGRAVSSVVDDIRATVEPLVAAEPGYHVEFGGQFESAASAGRTLALLGLAVTAGIALLLRMAFASWRDALLVMVNLPLALVGGAVGVHLSGGVLSIAAIIGFITVFGIATRNGIMLVSHIRHLQLAEDVADLREAVRRGSRERLAPILMTALASGLALVPLALAADRPGSEIQTPMARVILFGLLSSMVLNMLITPGLYLRLGRPARPAEGGES